MHYRYYGPQGVKSLELLGIAVRRRPYKRAEKQNPVTLFDSLRTSLYYYSILSKTALKIRVPAATVLMAF
jgi:hypothetical protein